MIYNTPTVLIADRALPCGSPIDRKIFEPLSCIEPNTVGTVYNESDLWMKIRQYCSTLLLLVFSIWKLGQRHLCNAYRVLFRNFAVHYRNGAFDPLCQTGPLLWAQVRSSSCFVFRMSKRNLKDWSIIITIQRDRRGGGGPRRASGTCPISITPRSSSWRGPEPATGVRHIHGSNWNLFRHGNSRKLARATIKYQTHD